MKRPAFQFYPGDWQRDPALRSCSVAARGLWMEMICIMHQADPYGHLRVNGNPIPPATLARMVGATQKEVASWTGELEAAGVFDRDVDGGIFSRRMVRDEGIRKARAEGGKLGGNPNLKNNHPPPDEVTPEVGDKVNLPPNLQPTPSSSSSSSSSRGGGARVRATRPRRPPETPIPADFGISEAVQRWAKSKGYGRLTDHLEAFRDKCIAKGYTYADWDRAFMTAIREDWARLRGSSPPAAPNGGLGSYV